MTYKKSKITRHNTTGLALFSNISTSTWGTDHIRTPISSVVKTCCFIAVLCLLVLRNHLCDVNLSFSGALYDCIITP